MKFNNIVLNLNKLKSTLLFVTAMLLVIFSGHSKAKENENLTTINNRFIHCSPWRNVVGYNAMFSDLNQVAQCLRMACGTGNSVSISKIIFDLKNSAGSAFMFASNQNISIADQNSILTAAVSWANAQPHTGYFVSNIQFIPGIITGPSPTYSVVGVKAFYSQCTGSSIDPTKTQKGVPLSVPSGNPTPTGTSTSPGCLTCTK